MSNVTKAAKISVIIPMYYCEEYIGSLLAYLSRQSVSDIEIICVDDGSPDGSSDIVKGYAVKDKRIKLIPQEHNGAGAARNKGLEYATGEYVMFLDADDVYDESYISRMYEAVDTNNADIAVCQCTTVDALLNRTVKNTGFVCIFYPADRAIQASSIRNLMTAVGNLPHCKIIRRDLIEENNIRFSETNSANDVLFSCATLAAAGNIVFIRKPLVTYMRHRNPKSITTFRGDNPKDHVRVCHHLYDYLRERGLEEKYRRAYCIKWGSIFHDYAGCCNDPVFVKNAVTDLTTEKPWTDMSDKELFTSARLYTAPSRKILKQERKKLERASYSSEQKKRIKTNCRFIEREIGNIIEVRGILEKEYGKSFKGMDNLLNVRLMQMKEAGLLSSLQILYGKIVNRML